MSTRVQRREEIQAEALGRARNGQSFANYVAVYAGFAAKGICAAEIEPRVNVLTYHAWQALGRQVRKGERGVKVVTFREERTTDKNGQEQTRRRACSAAVFHISQTDAVGGAA